MPTTPAVTGTPKFEHDDPEWCVFLGHADGHDLYVHPVGICPTYVARYGDDGPDYTSGAVFVGTNPHITLAHELATARGIAIDLPRRDEW